jgi:hypothetical protein
MGSFSKPAMLFSSGDSELPSAILSGDGIDEETRKVADILWLGYFVVRSNEQLAFAGFLSFSFS